MSDKEWHIFMINMLENNLIFCKNCHPDLIAEWNSDIRDLRNEIRLLDLVTFCRTGKYPL